MPDASSQLCREHFVFSFVNVYMTCVHVTYHTTLSALRLFTIPFLVVPFDSFETCFVVVAAAAADDDASYSCCCCWTWVDPLV